MHTVEWLGSSMTNLPGKAARDFASSSCCEHIVTKPSHIDEGVLDLVLTDSPDIVGVRVDSIVGTSDHSAVLIDVVLEQHICHLVCRQEVYLKNKVDLELIVEYVKDELRLLSTHVRYHS